MLSGLKRLDPFALLACLLPQTVIAMFISDPVVTALSLCFGLALNLRLRGAEILKKASLYALVVPVAGVINTFVNHRGDTPLIYLNDTPLTLEAFFYGARFALAVIAALLWFAALTGLFTSAHVIRVFGKASPATATVISAVLRYIPLFTRRIKEVAQARTALGAQAEGGIKQKLRGVSDNFAVMVTWSCESAVESADSMKARGYGTRRRTEPRRKKFTGFDLFVTAAGLLLTVAAFVFISLGGGDFAYYPQIAFAGSLWTYLLYAAAALLSALPLAVEAREELLWMRSR